MPKPAVDIEIDDKEFKRALLKYQRATSKDVPRILNHAATQAAFRAMSGRHTPTAEKKYYLGAAADPSRKRKKWNRANRLWFALVSQNGVKPPNRRAEATKIYRRRRQSVGFIRANWGAVVNNLGLKRSSKFPKNADIRVRRASGFRHEVSIYNATLEGSGRAKAEAKLRRGWNSALHDAVWGRNGMVDFAHKRLKKHWKR